MNFSIPQNGVTKRLPNKPWSKRAKGIFAISLLAIYAILLISEPDQKPASFQRELSGRIVHAPDRSWWDYEGPDDLRHLSIDLGGGGNCEVTEAEPLNTTNPVPTTTLLASYPGSGKRLTWRLLEALTGIITGDDWDFSHNGYDHVQSLKTSWPHPEGIFQWGSHMDQVILLVRNPRFAIPSYQTMRFELNYSTNWTQSDLRKDYIYTERPPVEAWNLWRDARFPQEMDRWCWYIDFWMQGGMRRNNTEGTGPALDPNCVDNTFLDCAPKTVIAFEKLYSTDLNVGIQESLKISAVLDNVENVNVISEEARACVYEEVMNRAELYFKRIDWNGPDPDLKTFTSQQLNSMRAQVVALQEKYSEGDWLNNPVAVELVDTLNSYVNDIQAEYDATFIEEQSALA